MIRLLIVDDHPVVRAGLVGMLSDEPGFEVVGEAADGDQASRVAAATRPDVVLMDLRMPGVDGVELACRGTIRKHGSLAVGVDEHDDGAGAARSLYPEIDPRVLQRRPHHFGWINDSRRGEIFKLTGDGIETLVSLQLLDLTSDDRSIDTRVLRNAA